MTEDQIKHMVNRFLMWKLPKNFNPDGGISFEKIGNGPGSAYVREPVGTNLLDATQAHAMVRHMLDGLPSNTPPLAWNAGNNRSYEPVETRAKSIFDANLSVDHAGKKWNWVPGGNSTKQDEAREIARRELRAEGHPLRAQPAGRSEP